jgi:hypothetical protein
VRKKKKETNKIQRGRRKNEHKTLNLCRTAEGSSERQKGEWSGVSARVSDCASLCDANPRE